jgi:hypothetical protein
LPDVARDHPPHETAGEGYNPAMKIRAGLLAAILVMLSAPVVGKELKPDRVISVTSLEHREGKTDKSYEVSAKAWKGKDTKSEPILYYKLACGTGAAYLEAGSRYEAQEAYSKDGTKILMIFDVKSDPNDIMMIACDVESVKTLEDSKR